MSEILLITVDTKADNIFYKFFSLYINETEPDNAEKSSSIQYETNVKNEK